MAAGRGDALSADYAKAGFGGTLGFGSRPALILVDLARAYVDPHSPLYLEAGAEALSVNAAMVSAFHAASMPVVYTRVVYQAGGADGGLFYARIKALACFDEGNPLGAFDPRLGPLSGDLVVTKQYPSAFFGTSLAATLHASNCDTCVIAGFSTSGCVRATALDALCHGFRSLVVEDGCADRDLTVHRQNLFDLDQKYADVISSAQVIAQIGTLASRS